MNSADIATALTIEGTLNEQVFLYIYGTLFMSAIERR
jgi:hypothetical protein